MTLFYTLVWSLPLEGKVLRLLAAEADEVSGRSPQKQRGHNVFHLISLGRSVLDSFPSRGSLVRVLPPSEEGGPRAVRGS